MLLGLFKAVTAELLISHGCVCVCACVRVCVLPVFVTLTCAFRYGREDLDVLGLTFRKDLFLANIQAFPPPPSEKNTVTRLQERLIKKLGEHAHPFTFQVPAPSRDTPPHPPGTRPLSLQGHAPSPFRDTPPRPPGTRPFTPQGPAPSL